VTTSAGEGAAGADGSGSDSRPHRRSTDRDVRDIVRTLDAAVRTLKGNVVIC
jgi:hypothetical protein